jgi:cytochrome c oxidase subunit 2
MRVNVLIFIILNFLFLHNAQAKEAATPAGLEYCTVCHGSQLMGNVNIGAPRLTGLSTWYIERQLLNFKSGKRGSHPEDTTGGEMMLMVGKLSDDEIEKIAKWVTTTESSKPKAIVAGDMHLGEKKYQACTACHGEKGEGNKALGAPKLNGLNDWYLVTQLNHFRLGYRGTDKSDSYGQQMQAASSVVLSEEDAANLATYIYQLK